MAWTVLLVEDELFLRESIKEIIQWDDMNMRLIGEASNGVEALTIIESESPDLVISDIMMPFMDGVELLVKTRSAGIGSKFIMLTCMNEFDYVQKSLQYGASSYILKLSMTVKSLREALCKIHDELEHAMTDSNSEAVTYYRAIWEEMRHSVAPAQEHAGGGQPFRGARESTLRMIVILHGQSSFSIDQLRALHLIDSRHAYTTQLFTETGITTVFLWSIRPVQFRSRAVVPYAMILSPAIKSSHLEQVWRGMMRQLGECWYTGRKEAVDYEGSSQDGPKHAATWSLELELIRLFEQRNIDACERHLENMWDRMREQLMPLQAVVETAGRLEATFRRIAESAEYRRESLLAAVNHEELYKRLSAYMKSDMRHWIDRTLDETDHHEINKVRLYIQQHYEQQITVKSMAKYVAMDETYLSNLFKKKTGETLIRYLHKIRFERSVHYLERTNLSINDIAEKVGFMNTNYFNRIFKRLTGLTPGDYRKNVGQR
ncbi:response regulator [Paenibacillus sp. strain BS8-2]